MWKESAEIYWVPATNQKVARSSRAGRIKFFSNLAQLTVITTSSTDALTDALNCIPQLSQDKRRDFMNYHEIPSLFSIVYPIAL